MKTKRIIDGSDFILHGGDYNPDQWLDRPDIIDEDFRLMELAGCNTFSIGIFSWTRCEPEEGRYEFGWLDNIMDRLAAAGHRAILATPSGAKPAWLSVGYPEIRRVNRDGLREPHRARHNHCWSSPVYRGKVQAINAALAQRYQGHPALAMWHVSNEYNDACYCDLCIAAFQQWLERKHGTLAELNRRWWSSFWNHIYTDWRQIDPRDDSVDAMLTDWSRFHTGQVIDFYQAECRPLERFCPGVPRTTNLMGFYGPIDYWKLAAELDMVADDSYPALDRNKPTLWQDVADLAMVQGFLRTAAKRTGRPWLLMESTPSIVQWKPAKLKAPGMHQAEALNAIAHGAEGVLYFQWRKGAGGYEKFHGAVVDHEGSGNTRVFREVAALGRRFAGMAELLGSEVRAEVALVYDWESRWQLCDSCGTLSHGSVGGRDAGYNPQPHYRELWRRAIAADVISTEHDFSPYKLVVAPQLFMLKPGMADKIRDYVRRGGIFVGTYYLGYVNEDGSCLAGGWPGGGLREVFGIWNEEYDLVAPGECQAVRFAEGLQTAGSAICEMIHAEGAEVLAEYAGDFYAGRPAATRHAFGQGQAFYMATELAEEGLRALYGQILGAAALADGSPCVDKPDHVSVCRRGRFAFITNWSPEPARLDLGENILRPFGESEARGGCVSLDPFECLCGTMEREPGNRKPGQSENLAAKHPEMAGFVVDQLMKMENSKGIR